MSIYFNLKKTKSLYGFLRVQSRKVNRESNQTPQEEHGQ